MHFLNVVGNLHIKRVFVCEECREEEEGTKIVIPIFRFLLPVFKGGV